MPEWLYSNLCINWLNGQNKRKHLLIDIPERVDNVPQEHLDIIWGPGFKESEEIRKIKSRVLLLLFSKCWKLVLE
jgi:hypothetical protein